MDNNIISFIEEAVVKIKDGYITKISDTFYDTGIKNVSVYKLQKNIIRIDIKEI